MGFAIPEEPKELACEFGNMYNVYKPDLCPCEACKKIRKLELQISKLKNPGRRKPLKGGRP